MRYGNEEVHKQTDTAHVYINVDTLFPWAQIIVPSDSDPKFNVHVKADDPNTNGFESGLDSITVYHKYDGNGWEVWWEISCGSDTSTVERDSLFDSYSLWGGHYFKAKITDVAGNIFRTDPPETTTVLAPPNVDLVEPDGDEYKAGGLPDTIKWKLWPAQECTTDLFLSTDDGESWEEIALDTIFDPKVTIADTSFFEYHWNPDTTINSENCKIMVNVMNAVEDSDSDTSKNNFTIDSIKPTVIVNKPIRGGAYALGDTLHICWDGYDSLFTIKESLVIDIDLSRDGGETWQPIEKEIKNECDYVWPIPNETDYISKFCKIRVTGTDFGGLAGQDTSGVFQIGAVPVMSSITVRDSTKFVGLDSMYAAKPGWCNDLGVQITLGIGEGLPDSVLLSTSWCNSSVYDAIISYEADEFDFPLPDNVETEYTLTCRLKNEFGESGAQSATIKLDRTAPNRPLIDTPDYAITNMISVTVMGCDTTKKDCNTIDLKKPNRVILALDSLFSIDRNYYPESDFVGDSCSYVANLDYVLQANEGWKNIYCTIGDSAGNWSDMNSIDKWHNPSYDSTYLDMTPPRVTKMTPVDGNYSHQPDSIIVHFSEIVKPVDSWRTSIRLRNVYTDSTFLPDIIEPINATPTESAVAYSNGINDPSHFEVIVDNFSDLAGRPGRDSTISFHVYMEKETGGTVRRIMHENIQQIVLTIEPQVLPAATVFLMEKQNEPPAEEFEHWEFDAVLPNSCWEIFPEIAPGIPMEADSLQRLVHIYFNSADVKNNDLTRLRMAHNFNVQNWMVFLESTPTPGNDDVADKAQQHIAGEYCIVERSSDESVYNYPNPFNPRVDRFTTIVFSLKPDQSVNTVRIFDLFGNLVKTISVTEGEYHVDWDGTNDRGEEVSNGGYLCFIKKGLIRKIAVLK